MLALHPEIIEKDGQKKFVMLPYEEFVQLQQRIGDLEDLVELQHAMETDRGAQGRSLDEVRKELGLS